MQDFPCTQFCQLRNGSCGSCEEGNVKHCIQILWLFVLFCFVFEGYVKHCIQVLSMAFFLLLFSLLFLRGMCVCGAGVGGGGGGVMDL